MPNPTPIAVLGGATLAALSAALSTNTQDSELAALDANGDGRIGKYEAVAAVLALVDDAAQDGADASDVSVEAFARAAARRRDQNAQPTASPLELQVEGDLIHARGSIDRSACERLVELLLTQRDPDVLVLHDVRTLDGSDHTARLAAIARDAGLGVRIPRDGVIDRATATTLVMALDRRWVERGARVGRGDSEETAAPDEQLSSMRTESSDLVLCPTGSTASLRGLAAVDVRVAWATGTGPTVLRTVDGGATFVDVAPESIEGLDVRDVQAFGADDAWILTAGPGEASRILTTDDGGETWTERHRETAPGSFLDGFDAWDAERGIAYGDPFVQAEGEDGPRFRVLATGDGGVTWTALTTTPAPLAGGEASFAASGTGIRALDGARAWIATGASDALGRVLCTTDSGESWSVYETTIPATKPASGVFSLAFRADGVGVAVGGDFTNRPRGGVACASWTDDFGVTWHAPEVGPRGQRAGSVALKNGHFLATGQTGTDISRDGGRTWQAFSSEGFHCVEVAARDGAVWFAGPEGRVATLRR